MNGANQPIEFYQVESGSWTQVQSEIIIETPVSLTVNGTIWLTFMCTPIDLEALAVGFLFNEGLIQSVDEVLDVRICPTGDNVDVWLAHAVEKPENWLRTSGCTGGVTSIDNRQAEQAVYPIQENGSLKLTLHQIGDLIEDLSDHQDIYRKSGGVHTSVLSDGRQTIAVGEDIGRHNTLDKIAGLCLIRRIQVEHGILLTTGRISSEMLQKASRIKAAFVISRTSPSSLSVQMARARGITLIGYARRNRFRVYTHHERITENASEKELSTCPASNN